MDERSKTLFSFVAHPFCFPVALVSWLIAIDGPTVNNIAIAVVWAYFEIQRRNDMKTTVKIAESRAAPAVIATKELTVKSDEIIAMTTHNRERLDKMEAAAAVPAVRARRRGD